VAREFAAQFAATPNLSLSLPVNILDFGGGGYRSQQVGVVINPTLEVSIPQSGVVKGLDVRLGQLENLRSSLTGLAYNPPDNLHPAFKDPFRPFPQGGDIGGTAFNNLDFQLFGFKIDPVAINTGPFGPNAGIDSNAYLGPYYFQQTSNVYQSAPAVDSFSAGGLAIQNLPLTQNAQPGSLYISYFKGPGCPSGCFFNGPNQPGEPEFSFVQTANQIVFAAPLPPGSIVSVSYQGFNVAQNTFPQRFDVGGRSIYHLPGVPGGSIGLTFNRIFDLSADAPYYAGAAVSNSLVSDTVFGFDFTLPLQHSLGFVQAPVVFGEGAASRYNGDVQRNPFTADGAAIIGLRFKLLGGDHTLSYQAVGASYMSGAPQEYSFADRLQSAGCRFRFAAEVAGSKEAFDAGDRGEAARRVPDADC